MTAADSAELRLLTGTAADVFRDCAERLPGDGWRLVHEAGLDLIALPEPLGAGWLQAAAAVARVAGETAVPLPYTDAALVAGPLLADAGLPVPDGLYVAAQETLAAEESNGTWRVRGTLRRVPWAAAAERIVAVAASSDGDIVLALDPARATVSPGANLAGEPRDTVVVDTLVEQDVDAAPLTEARELLLRRGALARSLLIAGAAAAVLPATALYASQRVQFGRPIARQQAVQHALAEIAAETEAVRAATAAAVTTCASGGFGTAPARTAIAVAKVQAGTTASVVARLAHQVHGAIGTTQEHPLHRHTLRLWSWRDEFGGEGAWAHALGDAALALGAWEVVTQ